MGKKIRKYLLSVPEGRTTCAYCPFVSDHPVPQCMGVPRALPNCATLNYAKADIKEVSELTIPAAVIETEIASAFEKSGLAEYARNQEDPNVIGMMQQAMLQIANNLKSINL